MDRVSYIDPSGLTKQITVNVVNVLASSQGVADESLSDTKRKAIARFRARQRIVTEGDYADIKDIISSGLPYSHARAILKRSDIKTNEVVLYVVLVKEYMNYEPQVIIDDANQTDVATQVIPIPTSSLTVDIDSTTTEIKPYAIYTENAIEYLCPFGFIKETDSNGYYYYLVKDVSVIPDAFVYDQVTYPLSFTNLFITSNAVDETVTFSLAYYNLGDRVNMSNIESTLYLQFKSDIKGPYTCDIDITNSRINFTVPTSYIKAETCTIEYHIKDTTTGATISLVKVSYVLKKKLHTYVYSSINTTAGVSTVYDVPCVLKSYYDGLTTEEKIMFETDIIQQIVSASTLSNYRMMNTSVNLKFANTYGVSKNYKLNETNKASVIDILDTPPIDPVGGDRYIVDVNATGAWAGKDGKIALYGISWVFLDSAPGDIIYVTNKTQKYTYSGNANKWFIPEFSMPFSIEAFVYVNSLADNDTIIVNAVKSQLLYVLTAYSGLDASQHRSVMYRAIQELGNYIDHCEIRLPEVDIVFNYDIDNFDANTLKRYVPEFCYTDASHIRVKVIRI